MNTRRRNAAATFAVILGLGLALGASAQGVIKFNLSPEQNRIRTEKNAKAIALLGKSPKLAQAGKLTVAVNATGGAFPCRASLRTIGPSSATSPTSPNSSRTASDSSSSSFPSPGKIGRSDSPPASTTPSSPT